MKANENTAKGPSADAGFVAVLSSLSGRKGSSALSRRGVLGATLAAALALFLLGAPAAQADKAVVGAIETLPGRESSPAALKGVAVNHTGTGGATAGDVYVVNSENPNNRIEVFSAAGAFHRAFGYDVVAAGPSNNGANEQQTVSVDATGGSFTLTTTTGATGFGDPTASSNVVTKVSTATGAFHVGDAIEGGCIPGGTTIVSIGSESLTLSASASSFQCPPHRALTAFETTAAIPFGAEAAEVQAALTALPGIDPADVAVSGPTGGPFTVEFTGALSHNDVPRMTASSTNLTGATHTATVATAVAGGGYEICAPLANPGDVCKAGSESAVAGGLSGPLGIAIDQASGNVYVVDANNSSGLHNGRVNVYSALGAFQGAFGWDVVDTGPDQSNEIQTIKVGAAAGTYKLSFGSGGPGISVTNPIKFDATAAEVQSAVAALTNITNAGLTVSVSGGPGNATGSNPYVVTFESSPKGENVAQLVAETGGLVGGTAAVNTLSDGGKGLEFCVAESADVCKAGTPGTGTGQIAGNGTSLPAVDPTNGHLYVPDGVNARVQEFAPTLNPAKEVTGIAFARSLGWDVVESGPDQSHEIQTITVKATAGAFKLTFGNGGPGISETAALKLDATHEELQSALSALTNVSGAGLTVTVSGGPGSATGKDPYVVTFKSSPKGQDVVQLKTVKVGLSGTAVVETFNDGGKGLEVCTVAAGDVCKAGVLGSHLSQFAGGTPDSVAVDSTGAVYAVIGSTNVDLATSYPCRLYKFSFAGPDGIEAQEFAPEQLSFSSGTASTICATDVAVDPGNDHVLIAKKEGSNDFKFLEFDSTGTLLEGSPGGVLESTSAFNDFHGLAIGTGGRFYFANRLGRVDILGPPLPPTVSIAPVSGFGSTEATFHGTVTPPSGTEHFQTTYHFEYSSDDFAHFSRIPTAEDASVGNGSGSGLPSSCPVNNPPSCEVQQTATGLQPGATYKVRLVATTGSDATSGIEEFSTPAAAPTIAATLAEDIGKTSAKLTGKVNPNGFATTYHFEWGTDTTYANRIPAEAESSAGAEAAPVKVSADLSGLKEGTAYHFRIVAENSFGEVKGPDQAFTALSAFGLPDGRAPEQVTPNDKRPVGLLTWFFSAQIVFQAALDGNATLFPLLNGLPDSTAGGNVEYLAQRGATGWQSSQMTPPTLLPPVFAAQNGNQAGRSLYASPDLSCQLIESAGPLTPDTPAEDTAQGVRNLYRRGPDGTHVLLSAPVPLNPALIGGYHVDWASRDCSHILFDTAYRLLGEAPASGTALYEWADGNLALAGVLPDGSLASGGSASSGGVDVSHSAAVAGAGELLTTVNSVSEDGSRVFFSAISNEGGDSGRKAVFVRKEGTETIDASQSQTAIANHNGILSTDGSAYQMAAADGSHVFFTSMYGIAPNATSTGAASCSNSQGDGSGCDLYDYDVEAETLTDLSADANPADAKGASVAGVLDASTDGSRVYFAARGQLVPGKGKTEAQNLLGAGSYNVYLSDDGALSFVGLISTKDAEANANSGTNLVAANHATWVADASTDGSHLLFVSKANVTGYESGGVAEVYLYSADTGETVCASCRPDGQPSVGSARSTPITPTQAGLERGAAPLANTVYRPRSLSDDGRRVFFKSPDVLTPGAREGAHNIYEWEEGQLYLLVAGEGGAVDFTDYADASATGDDVFITTKEKLIPQDFDNSRDLYDLRAPHVPGERVGPDEFIPPQEPCDPLADRCQAQATSQPGAGGSPASEAAGVGNPPTAKPCRKGQVKRHGRCVPKPAHHKKRQKRHHKRTANSNGRAPR